MALKQPAKTLKVSLVVSDLAGGGTVRAYLLGQVLKALDYDVEILGFLFGQQLYALPPAGLSIVSLPGYQYPQFFAQIGCMLNKINGDIIYAVKPKPTSFGVSLLKKFVRRRPVLLDMDDWEMSWHGGDNWTYRPSLKQFVRDWGKPNGRLRQPDDSVYVKWMENWVSLADGLTIDTQFLQRRFGGTYLPNGKDTELFNPALYDVDKCRYKYGLSSYRILMFPGAPRPHKGLEDVLIALDQLNQPDYRLVIVGGSPYDDYDDRLIDRWGRWIIKLPRCPVEQMPEILAAAHVIVVPQRDTLTAKAQFPLKLTDGMAMAKPVLSTFVGDIPEILGDSGYLVEPECPEQITKCIQQIFQDFDMANRKGRQARKICTQLYSVNAMSKTLAELIATLKIH
jgi:glycosyltransferase involved in cell wall biosynthesis